jgi:SAM-dependent methyltransferase
VSFGQADLRFDPIGRDFDLIVVAGVLEYFPKGNTLRPVIKKLAAALAPGGCLLVESTRAAQPAEEAWWWPMMPRGRRINELAGREASLREVASDVTADFCMTLYRKRP